MSKAKEKENEKENEKIEEKVPRVVKIDEEIVKKFSLNNPEYRKKLMEEFNAGTKFIFTLVDQFAKEKPNDLAIIEFDTGENVSWKTLATGSKAFAALLLSWDLKRGDVVATSLAFLKEHIYLWLGCMRIGVIMAPLDLRLKPVEIIRNFHKIKPKIYFFLGNTPLHDFRPTVEKVMKVHHVKNKGTVKIWVQFQKSAIGICNGAVYVKDFSKFIKLHYIWNLIKEGFGGGVKAVTKTLSADDPAVIIFTTGSTGDPKPALLSSAGIVAQSCALKYGFVLPVMHIYKITTKDWKFVVNLPPSHVGGLTEQLMSILYTGGCAILLHVFKAEKTLEAIQKYKAVAIGQIPSLFSMQWRLKNYKDYDVSSLRFGLYGGQAVSEKFLLDMKEMAVNIGSGMGSTEVSGLSSYTPFGISVKKIQKSLGYDSPLCKISIRKPMNDDGTAGAELEAGLVGELCFQGVQVFKGYLNDKEMTKKCLSKEGILYSGDLASYDDLGLHFSSRRKFIIKPKGFQVNPHEVEDHIINEFKKEIANIAVVGVPHEVYSEGPVAVIKLNEGQKLTMSQIDTHCKQIAAYKRPTNIVFLGKEVAFPLNRVAKTDYLAVREVALKSVKAEGWRDLKKEKEKGKSVDVKEEEEGKKEEVDIEEKEE